MLILLPLAVFFFSLPLGRYPISPGELLTVLFAKLFPLTPTWPAALETAIFQVRLPRIAAAMLVGAALAALGAAYQGMFKNPLVSPDILGAAAGAGFGAALAIYFSFGIVGIQMISFLFGLVAVFLAYALSTRIRHDPVLTLVLTGIFISTLFTAGTSLIKYMADPYDKLPAITFWLMGSLSSVSPRDVYAALLPILLGMIPLHLLRWRLNVLSLGEEEARALGLETARLRVMVILCSTLMTAASVSISGMIGWVGLLVPHLARMVVGPNYRVLIPATILMGGAYLLLVDDLARVLTTVEVPLGILTALIGAPFFLYAAYPEGMVMKLELKDFSSGYDLHTRIKGISLTVEDGDVVCLLGPNGSGKTTLFKTILGLLKLHEGEIRLDGEDIIRWPRHKLARMMGYIPQAHHPPFPFKVLDVVLMGRAAHLGPLAAPGREDVEIARRALATLNISHLEDRVYTEISGGERQLVLIARALAQQPRLLIMDEPTSALDFGNQLLVLRHVRNLARMGLAIIMATHFPDHALFCASRVLLLRQGRMYHLGRPEETITVASLKSLYGVDVKIIHTALEGEKERRVCVPIL